MTPDRSTPIPPASGDRIAKLRAAIALHQAGRLAEAEPPYRAVLAQDSRNFDATGQLDPQRPEPANGCGRAYAALGRFHDAVASFDRALALAPGLPPALNNRGNALRRFARPGPLDALDVGCDTKLLGPGLRPTRRYAHSLAYLRTIMRTNGFVELAVEDRVIRQEVGADVDGYVVVAQRAGA